MAAIPRQYDDKDEIHPDPITGAPGSHPVATGVGAAGAGALGAAVGSAAGPIGTAVGAVIGAVAGGLAGKASAELVDPTAEDAFWRENYRSRPYVEIDDTFEIFEPAYRYGYTHGARNPEKSFDDAEPDLSRDWDQHRGESKLDWDKARPAAMDAYERLRQRSRDMNQS